MAWLHLVALMLIVCFVLPHGNVTAIDFTRLQQAMQSLGGNKQNLTDWQRVMEESQALNANDKLRRINEFFNRRIQFRSDMEIWRQSDYWATPLETLAKGAGDCEDFTIAKYFTLLHLGIPVEQLRLIYVKARIGGSASNVQVAHMVLAYYPSPDAEPLVLDNLITDIRPASRRSDLQPVFSFNSQGVFAGVEGHATVGSGGVQQLSRWSDLLQRAREQGF